MKRVMLLALMAAVILPFAARAQAKADFSGTWTLDTAKSDPAPQGRGGGGGGGGGGAVTIKQTGTELSIMSEGRQGPQTLTYKLDGSESTNQMMGRGGAQTVKSTAKWDGSSLVIETTREFNGTSITTKEVRRLDNGGKDMHVETTTQTPNGEQKRKTVYTKSTMARVGPTSEPSLALTTAPPAAASSSGDPQRSNQSIPSLTRSNFSA